MLLRFLGTGAADWNGPDEHGDYRRLTSTLVNRRLLIDGTTQILDSIPADARITDMAFTHTHSDHFDPKLIAAIKPLRVHAHESWAKHISVPGVEVCPFTYFTPFDAGACTLIGTPANHSEGDYSGSKSAHFVVSDEYKTIYYALDGAWILYPEWQLLRTLKLDGMVIDATIGDHCEGDYRVFEHNSIPMVRIMTDTLRSTGVLRENAPVLLSHLARTLHPSVKDLDASLEAPLFAAHDGLSIEI